MKTPSLFATHRLTRLVGLGTLALLLTSPLARAGLTLEMNVIRYHQYGYYFHPYLNTNSAAPSVPFGDYLISSFGYPTNGSWSLYRFDTNGFNQNSGGSSGYGDFDGMIHELTNGLWSIYVTNTVTTNIYNFKITANISTNDLPYVSITSPTDGAVNVTNQPTYTWQGPTNYGGQVVYYYNGGQPLPVTQTSLLNPTVLYQGLNSFTAHYDSNSATAVVSSVPTNNAAQPISSWVSTNHLQDYATTHFTVGTADTSGTSHALVAHYPFDATNGSVLNASVDASGNGHHLTFNGSYGSQGGDNLSADSAAGIGAVQFHDGDGNSAGYLGWTNTPPALLSALAASFSISCWVKTSQGNFGWDDGPAIYGAGILSADNSGLANDSVPLALTGSRVGFNTGGSSEDVTVSSLATINDGNYHHVVVTRNQVTGQKIIYVDGLFDSFGSGSTNLLSDAQKLTLGALADASDPDPNNFNYYNGFDGLLDDLQIYTGVLSSNEVANLFATPGSTTPNSSGGHQNLAHFAFEDGTSTFQLGVDSSPNGNNLSGYSYWGQVHTNVSDAVAGTNAVEFFGTSSMNANNQVLTNLNEVLAGSFSFSAWVKTTASRGNDSDNAYFGATIFWAYNDHNNTNDTIPLAITGSKAAFTTRGGDSGASDTLHSITSVNDGNYHLITVTRDQATGEKKMYVDGTFESSEFGTTNPLNGNDYYLSIGGTVYSSYTGILDELQIYSGVLSAGDVAYLYANPGSVVADITGSDFNAALNTTALTWTTGGDSNWFIQTTNTHDNVSAARSGAITDDTQNSHLETTVTGPGTLSFWWQTAADDFDFDLEFRIDGNYMDDIYGNSSWTQSTYSIGPGQHTLTWVALAYDFIPATDAGYLDEVSFVPAIPPTITLNPFSQTNLPGYNIALLAAATSSAAINWQWYKQNSFPVPNPDPLNLIPGATNAFYIPADSGTPNAGAAYFAIASNGFGSATTAVALVIYQLAPLPPDWSRAFTTSFTNNPAHATTNINLASLVDSAGNLYTVGSLVGTNVFGTNILISPNGREGSSFLKQTATGTPIWGRCMTNNGNGSSFPRGLAAAPGDGFYVSGSSYGTNWLGTNLLANPEATVYLARFDANGSNLWLRIIGGTNGIFPTHHTLVSDPAGNVTISVLISGFTSFGTTNFFTDGQKGVLAQYDSNGNVRWIQQPSAWPDGLSYSAGRIYGCMGGDLTNHIGGVTNISDRRRVLFSINATNGQGIWMQAYAAQKDQGSPNSFGDNNASVAVSGGDVFVVGTAYGTNVTFGPFTLNYPDTTGQYLARYDTNGTPQLATAFGSRYTWTWATLADAAGNVYVGCDFDTYSIFGNKILAAPFNGSNGTIQFVGTLDVRIPGQACVAKFDRNGNPLWARLAQSQTGYLNLRDITLAADGVWASGFFNPIGSFGTNTIYGGVPPYRRSGYLAKITDGAAAPTALPVSLINAQIPGASFQFQFQSQAGFTHVVQYRTNLVAGQNWQTYSNVTGDGALKTIPLPISVFSPASQGFVRILTQ